MSNGYIEEDYQWIRELMGYPAQLERWLEDLDDTSRVRIPEDPIESVIFQSNAKQGVRKVAQSKGHLLMVGKPGTGKSMLANMFQTVLDQSFGDYIRPKEAIVAYPGKDRHHIRIAYERPDNIDDLLTRMNREIEAVKNRAETFSLADQIHSVRRWKLGLLAAAAASAVGGLFFAPAFIVTGLAGIGAIFMVIQENNHQAQEKIQNSLQDRRLVDVKHLQDMLPEVLFDPRNENMLMARIAEPDSRNMKGGFRHDPYQSGNLQTPPHKRAYLGAHATSPIIYIDELKTLIKAGYMPDLLEVMQNKSYYLEGGRNTGSGAADRSETPLKADNIIVACCNYDTLTYLQKEGDGAFLSRIEDKGEVVHMESAVAENAAHIHQVAQYVRQEVDVFESELTAVWGDIIEQEGPAGVKQRLEKIYARPLPDDCSLSARHFSKYAVMEIVKELRCRASDRKLSCVLRPINGIIKSALIEAVLNNADRVEPDHVRTALKEHLSLEGALSIDANQHKKDLKKYIGSLTDSVGFAVGLAVIQSSGSGRMFGQPLPIRCQVNAGGPDVVIAPGRLGDIARAAAQNVRASIRKVLNKLGAPYVGYEMHVEYIQAHGGVEGDSASTAIDMALVSDFIRQPINQKYGVTGSLTGDIILAVGGVSEKLRAIMDPALGMEGACIPWLNKHDVEPHLINTECEYIRHAGIPGIRIFRQPDRRLPFDVFFCKTKDHAYRIMMGIDQQDVEQRMIQRTRQDLNLLQQAESRRRDADDPLNDADADPHACGAADRRVDEAESAAKEVLRQNPLSSCPE